jgi:outer membrane protein
MLSAILCLSLVGEVQSGAPQFISLENAWRIGLRESFSMANARDAVRAAEIGEFQARSRFFPKITPSYFHGPNDRGFGLSASQALPWLGGELTAERTSHTFDGVLAPSTRAVDTSFTWAQPLLRGLGPNASLYELRNARRAHEAQERSLVIAKQQFMVELARVHYQTLAQRELLSVAKQSAERSVALRKASEARLEVGLSNKLDVYRAQLSESQAEQSTTQAETALQAAIERFRFLLGRAPSDVTEPAPGDIPTPVQGELGPVETLVEIALQNRLDLRETQDQIEDARRTASLSRQNLLPDMTLNLRYTEQRGGGATGPSVVTNKRWESFLSASLPLERAADVGQLQLANLDVKARERNYAQRRYEVESEVRAAHRDLLSLARSIETQSGAVSVADQQLQLANLRYQRGLASNFDVVDAEGSLLAARSSLVQLLAAYQVQRLDLERVIGRMNVNLEPAP